MWKLELNDEPVQEERQKYWYLDPTSKLQDLPDTDLEENKSKEEWKEMNLEYA